MPPNRNAARHESAGKRGTRKDVAQRMGWETRDGRDYYYRKRRVGGQVVSVYVGGGLIGTLAAREDAHATHKRRAERDTRASPDVAAMDDALAAFAEYTDALATAHLLAHGYHRHHRGEWRKRRDEDRHGEAER
jgi:hypothetical protein